MGSFMITSARMTTPLIFVILVSVAGLAIGDAGPRVDGSFEGSVKEKVEPLVKEVERLRHHVGGLDSTLQQKNVHIATIEKELAVLKEHGGGKHDDSALSKLQAELESTGNRVKQLEEQAAAATKEADQAHRYAEALKKRAETAEEKVRDLDVKLEKSETLYSESKKRNKEIEKALKDADATVLEAEKRLEAHGEELSRVHNQWLPPWVAAHLAILQSRAKAKWLSHAKPGVDKIYNHASKGAADVHAFIKPHYEKVGPAARKQWQTVSNSVAPHVELVRTKSRQGFETFKKDYVGKAQEFMQPRLNAVVETGRPYVSYVQERTRPIVDHVSSASKPYLDHARNVAGPYIEKALAYYRGAVSAAVQQHANVQEALRTQLSKHDSLASIATKELVWVLASFVLAVPIVSVLLLFSSAVKKKPAPRKPSSGHSGHKHKRARKADK